jgi:hypothetical protein
VPHQVALPSQLMLSRRRPSSVKKSVTRLSRLDYREKKSLKLNELNEHCSQTLRPHWSRRLFFRRAQAESPAHNVTHPFELYARRSKTRTGIIFGLVLASPWVAS